MGIDAFVQSVDGADPGLATRWATRIEDENHRLLTLEGAADRWYREQPTEAAPWMEKNLPAEMAQKIFTRHSGKDQ
jgi:hypothetical protein